MHAYLDSPSRSENAMSQRRERERRRQRNLSQSSQLQEQTGTQVATPGREQPATSTVAQLQDTFGNQFVLEALSAPAPQGPSAAAAQAIQLGIAGVEARDQVPASGSMSVLRAQIHADLRSRAGEPLQAPSPDLERALRRSGRPLPPAVRARMEAAFGHDFSHVRIHTDSAAARAADDIQARAFAVGSELYFGAGQFSPDTHQGQEVLAHELAHVEQADQGRLPLGGEGLNVSTPSDKAEVEAVARARVVSAQINTLSSAELGLAAPAAMSVQHVEASPADTGAGQSDAAPVMRDALGSLGGLSRQLRERSARRSGGSSRPRGGGQPRAGTSPGREQRSPDRDQQAASRDRAPQGGQAPRAARERGAPQASAPDARELLADALATAIATILPPEDERQLPGQGEQRGGPPAQQGGRPGQSGPPQQARGGQRGAPDGQQRPGQGTGDQQGQDAELSPEERLEQFVTGQIIEPVVAEVGLNPAHVQQALNVFRPREQEQLRGRAQQQPERDPQTLLDVVPQALERAAPLLDQLRAEAGEGGVQRPEAAEVDQAVNASPEAEATAPPVVIPEPTPSTEPGPSARPQTRTTPSAAAPVEPQRPTGQLSPAQEAEQVQDEQEEIEEALEAAEQESEEATAAAEAAAGEQEQPEANPVPTGRGRVSSAQESYEQQRDYLENEIHKVEIDLEWNETDLGTTGGKIDGKQERIVDTQGLMDDNADRRDRRRELVEQRNERAQAEDKPPQPPDKDGQLRFHDTKAKRYPDELKVHERDVNKLKEETDRLNEEQERLNELMTQLQEELNALEPPSSGGAAQGPQNVPKICEKLGEQIEREKTELQRTVDTLTRETEELQTQVETLTTTLGDLQTEYDTAYRDWRSTQGDLDAVDASLSSQQSVMSDTPGTAGGQSTPTSSAGDSNAQCIADERSGLEALLSSLENAWRTDIPARRSTAEGQKTEAEAELATKTTELEEAEREIELMELAITTLEGGTLLWEQIAGRFGLHARVYFYPPGHRPWNPDDEYRTEEQMAAEQALFAAQTEEQNQNTETDDTTGPVSLTDATAADREADNRQDSDTDSSSSTQTAAQRQEERERQEQLQRDTLLRNISAARDMPPEERERRLAQLGAGESPSKTPAQLAAMLDQTHSDTATAIASQNIRAPISQSAEERQRIADAAGVSVESLQRWSEEQVRQDHQARAAQYLGMPADQAQEAADRLATLGAARGLTGPELLNHLAFVPPEVLQDDPELAAMADQVRAAAAADPDFARDKPEGMSLAAWREQQQTEARDRQNTIVQTRAVAERLGVSFGEVDGYISSLASASGVDASVIRTQLQQGGGPGAADGGTMSAEQINARLSEIHLITDSNQRAAALAQLNGQVPTQQLMGALLANGEQGHGLVEGPVANQQLDARLDAIASMPMQQQWEAYANLSRMTGMPPDDLMRAQRNRDTRDQALTGVSAIRSNGDLSPQERERRLDELAERMNLTRQQLNEAYEASILATQAALARAAGRSVPQGPRQPGAPLTDNLFEGVPEGELTPAAQAIRDLQQGNLSGEDAERKIMQVAELTGMDPADLRRYSAVATMEHNQREWGARLGMEGPEAARQLTTWAEQRGLTPDEMMDHLRRLPPDQCPPEMREAQRNLMQWDRDNAGENQHQADVDELARRRAEAGLEEGEQFHRIITNPAEISAIQDPTARAAAQAEYDDYCRLRDKFINEMDETIVDDDDAIAILREMTPAQRAALIADPAAVDEDNYHPLEAFRNGVEDEELSEGVALFGQAAKYNEALTSGVQERVNQATTDAIALEQRTQQTLNVAAALGTTDENGQTTPVSVAEANARIDALAMHNQVSRDEAARMIRTAEDPQVLFAPLFTVARSEATRPDGTTTTRVQPSQAFRQELTRVNALPAAERREALARLQAISGLSDEDLHAAQGELTVENHVVQTLHQARELPAEERQRVMERLEEQTGRTSAELQGIYDRVQEEDREALGRAPQATAHIQRLRDCPVGDLQRNAEEVARETGMPVETVLRLAQADRSQQPGHGVQDLVGDDSAQQEAFRNEAYRYQMSVEEFADFLARSPAGELPENLQQMRSQVLASGYQIQRTEAEQEARQAALGDPNDPTYIAARNTLMGQLTHDCDDEIIINTLQGMTPAQRKMFFEEWEARRLAGGRVGGGDSSEPMQEIGAQLRDALQGGDEDRGLALLAASNEFNPAASLELDVQDPTFTGHRDALLAEIQPPGRPNARTVREHFEQMTPAQRAQFLRDEEALINAATAEKNAGRRGENEIPTSITTLLSRDHSFQVMINDARSLSRDNTAQQQIQRTRDAVARVQQTDRAIEALDWQGDRFQAYTLLQSMAGDYQLSNENMLRMLEGRELEDDSDQTPDYIRASLQTAPSEARRIERSDSERAQDAADASATQRESQGDTLAGYTMDSERVSSHAEQIQSFLDGEWPRPTPRQVTDMLQGLNPRELSELDRRLEPGGLASLTQQRRDANGRYLPRVFGEAAIELNALERRAEDYRAVEREDRLVLELSANDPRASIDPSTPDGLAQRLAWARGLPPEQRVAELNRLQGQLRRDGPVDFGATIAQAYLGGSLGGSSQVMRPALLAQVQAAQDLPPSQRDAQLAMLARLSGHSEVRELEQAASRSQANLRALTEFQRIEDMPESERLAEINRICQSTGMSEGELRLLLEQAENSGVLDRPLQELSDEAEQELDRIKDIQDPEERRVALEALGRTYGLTTADMIAHLNQQASSAREESQRRVAAARQAEEIEQKIRGGDEDEIRAIMQQYGNDPENFQRILREYPGGVEALQRALRSEFGRNDPDNIDFLDMIDRAQDYTPAPELPAGVDPAVSSELRDILRRFPQSNDPETARARDAALAEFKIMNGLSEAAFGSLQAYAEHESQNFDQEVERRAAMIRAETDSMWVDDERMRELIMGSDPELLHALLERYPDLMNDALEGTGGDTYEDIEQQISQARTVMDMPYAERADQIRDMRVEYKVTQLEEEFGSWVWNDAGRVQELLADCSEEELRLLDERFGGQLAEKIEEVSKPTIFQSIVTVVAYAANPLYAYMLIGSPFNYEHETEMAALQGQVRAGRADGDGTFAVDQSRVSSAVEAFRDELDSTLWVSDSTLLSIMGSLNPAELMALREQIEGDGPNAIPVYGEDGQRMSMREILEANMSGDTLAQAVATLADAEDTVNGRNRREEMQQVARDLAIKDRMAELKKDPRNRDKSPQQLYQLAVSDQAAIAKATQDRVKKIQDSANSLFKSIDGWGDDEKEVLKTLSGLSPEEIDLVKVEYRRHFGKDLETQMREDMGLGDWKPSDGFEAGGFWESSFTDHNEGKMALMMMSKEHRAEGVREFLLEYSDRAWCEDEDLIFQTLESMSVEERTKIVTMPGSEEFLYRIKRDLGTHEAQMVDALVAINPETGKAEANKAHVAAVKMKMAMHGSGDWWDFSSWGTDENDFLKQLDGLTPEEVKQAAAYYDANLTSFGSFHEEIMSDFGTSGADYRVIMAELRGDKVEADIQRLDYAADGWGTDEKLIEETLSAGREGRGGRGEDHLAQVRQGFDNSFGREGGKYADTQNTGQSAIDIMLGQETDGMERVYFQQLAEKGKADDEITLLYAMSGAGTDEEKVKKVLAELYEKSPEDRAAFARRFRQMSVDLLGVDQTLEEWVEGDMSGTEGFEAKMQLMGKPQTPEEYLERAQMRYEHERGGLWNQLVGNVFMDGLEALGAHSNGSLLIKQMGEIESMFGPDGKLKDPAKFDQLKELCEWEAQDAQRYRETRDKVADAVSNTIQVVGAVVVTVVTAGAGSGVLVAVIANLAVSLAATAVKAAMKGGGYGIEELGMDLANAAVSAAFAGVGAIRAAGQAGAQSLVAAIKAGKKLTEVIAKQGIKGIMKEALLDLAEGGAEGLLKGLINSEGALAQGDGAFLKHLLKETAMGGVRKVATTALGKGLGKTSLGKKLAEMDAATQGTGALLNKGNALSHLGLKYVDNVIKGGFGTVLDHNKWEQWAKGEGVDINLIKSIFIDKAIESLIEVGARRTTAYQQHWTKKNLAKAKKESDELWKAYDEAQLKYDDPDMIEQVFGPRLEANQQAIMLGEQNVARLNQQVADENSQVIAQRQQTVQRVLNQIDDEENRTHNQDPDADMGSADTMRAAARRMVEDAGEAAEELAQGRRPAGRQRSSGGQGEQDDVVLTRKTLDQAEDGDDTRLRPKRTISQDETDQVEAKTSKPKQRSAVIQGEDVSDSDERWQAFGNIDAVSQQKAGIIGAKALTDDGEFSPALKAKLEKLGYTVRKNNVIARSDTGDQVPLHIEGGVLTAGLKPQGKKPSPTHLANELLPGGSRGRVWKQATQLVDQEITLEDGRRAKVTRVVPTVLREGVDSEGGAITARRIAVELEGGEVVYKPLSDFDQAAPGPRSVRRGSEPDIDATPILRALSDGDVDGLTGGDPGNATKVFAQPGMKRALNRAFEDSPEAPAARQRQVKALLDSFGGDFEAAHESFAGSEAKAVRKALNTHRGLLVSSMIREVQEAFPGLRVKARRLDPNAPTLQFEFEGGETAHARAFLEDAARDLFGGSLKSSLGVELSEAPVRLRADADVDSTDAGSSIKGRFSDPISYEEDGVTKYFSDGKGGKWGYSTAFGFSGGMDSDGAFVVRQKVLLVSDDLSDDGVQRVKSDVEAANATYYNDPKHRIVVDDVERPLRQELDVEIITSAQLAERQAAKAAAAKAAADNGEDYDPGVEPTVVNIHKGAGRADSSNLYTEGPDSPATDQYRQMVIAHELAHAIWGLADRYEDGPQRMENPNFRPGVDHPSKKFIDIRSEARKSSTALHVSHEGGLMEDFNVAYVQGKQPMATAKSWEDVALTNWKGLRTIYEESNQAMPVKPDGQPDWAGALKQLNPQLRGEDGSFPHTIPAGEDVVLPKLTAPKGWGVSSGNLKQLEWTIAQGRKGSVDFELGDGGVVDQVTAAEKNQVFARPSQRYSKAAVAKAKALGFDLDALSPDAIDATRGRSKQRRGELATAKAQGGELDTDKTAILPAVTGGKTQKIPSAAPDADMAQAPGAPMASRAPRHRKFDLATAEISETLEAVLRKGGPEAKQILLDFEQVLRNKPAGLPEDKLKDVFRELCKNAVVSAKPTPDIDDDGTQAYMSNRLDEYSRRNQKAIVEGMDDDSVLVVRDRPKGAQDFDGVYPQKPGTVKDTDLVFKYGDGRRMITDTDGEITTVLSDTDVADYLIRGRWAGDETLEGTGGAGARINKNLGVDGIQHGMLTRGLTHDDKYQKILNKLGQWNEQTQRFDTPERIIKMFRDDVYIFEKSESVKGYVGEMPLIEAVRKLNPEAYAELARKLPAVIASELDIEQAAPIAAKAPGAMPKPPAPSNRPPRRPGATEGDEPGSEIVRPGQGQRSRARGAGATPEVEIGEIKGSQGREKVEGTKRYNDGTDAEGFAVRSTARAARRDDDVTFNWPPGMPDADKQAFVRTVMGKLGLEIDNPDFDSFTGWSKGKDVVRAQSRQLEDVLFEGSSASPRRDLQGSTHRFTALMHIVESGELGALKLTDVVGAGGETVEQLYTMWRRGEIGAQNAPDCFEPDKARAMVQSIRKNGYITDQAKAAEKGLVDPANRGEIHGINVLPADRSGQDTSIDAKINGWQRFVLSGGKPRSQAEWEQFRAMRLADEALETPDMAPAPKGPMTPKAPGWDDELEITAPIPGSKLKRPGSEDELEVTADLPPSGGRRGFHDDITADVPAPSRTGRGPSAEDVETFRGNFNYDNYERQLERLLSERPELQRLAKDNGLDHDEMVAIYAYSRADYNDMNMGLRGEEPEFLAEYAAQIRVTNSALAKLPAARGTVFRRVKSGEWLDAYQEGETVTEKAYTSTSNDYDTMLGHAGKGSVEFVIKSRTGRDITQVSGKGELENEVLFAPGTRFRVKSRMIEDDGTVVIYMDEEADVAPSSPRPRAPGQGDDDVEGLAPGAPKSGSKASAKGGKRAKKHGQGDLDLEAADYQELRAHGLSKREANKILGFREQNGGVFDFELYAAMHGDHELRVVGTAARRAGREAEAVAAVKKQGENEAEAAQRVGIDPSDFGDKVQVHRVAELHNHFKGVLDYDEFPRLLFPEVDDPEQAARQTLGMLRQLYKDDPGNELRLPHKAKATEAIERILDSDQAESDPLWTLRRVMTASEEMPFDYTYDPRGLLIDQLKGGGKAEDFVRATAKRLVREGVTYAEMQGKISTPGVSVERFQEICAEEGVKIRMLPQLLTHQFAEGGDGFSDDKLMKLMFGDDYSREGEVPDMVGGIDICGPESGRWTGAGMDQLERAFGIVDTEAQFSGRQLVFRPHVGEGYSGTEAQRRLGVEGSSKQAATAKHNLGMILDRLEKMEQEGTYTAPPAGHVQVRLGHVTATTPELAQRMARLGVIAEVNVGSNQVTGANKRATDGDRLDEHPLPVLLYYGVKTVLSTDAQGVMSTDIPKEYGSAAEIIKRFRSGQTRITIPEEPPADAGPDWKPKDFRRVAWGDLTPEQQARFDVGWLERGAQEMAAAGTWDGGHRGATGGLKIRRQKLSYTRSTTSRATPTATRPGPNRRPDGAGDPLRDRLAFGRTEGPEALEEALKRNPPDQPKGAVVMNLLQNASVAFEDLVTASADSPSMSEALTEFHELLADWLEHQLRQHHPNARIRAAGTGSSRMQLVIEGADQDVASNTLTQICEQAYGQEWERSLGVQIREPVSQAGR
jgi:hypothetical protein